jgi:hypothetical protein
MSGLGLPGSGLGGGLREGNCFIFTQRSLPFAVNYRLIENGAHCQPDKRRRSKCKDFFLPDPMDDLDHLK